MAGDSVGARTVALEPVERDRIDVLNALFELYAHDFSEYGPLALKESGRFEVSVRQSNPPALQFFGRA